MTPARQLAAAIGGCAAGSALVLGAANENWAEGVASQGLGLPVEEVALTSYNVAPAVGGLAVLALAAAAALVATRGSIRRFVGVLVLVAGAAITAIAIRARAGAETAAAAMREDLADIELTPSPWTWAAAAGGLVVLAAGLLTAVRGHTWPSMSRRYDAAGVSPRAVDARNATPEDVWRALDRGDDPTAQ